MSEHKEETRTGKSREFGTMTSCCFHGSLSRRIIIWNVECPCALKKSYTREKSLHIFSMLSGTVHAGTDRSAHVPLKSLTQEKNPYTLFPCSVGLCRDRYRSAHVPLTREKSFSMFGGAVQGQIGVPMCP